MKTASKGLLIAVAVVLATATTIMAFNASTATNIILKSAQSTAQSATPTPSPTKSYPKLSGTWTYDCEFPVQRPEEIMLTCADGGMIVTDIKWKTWTATGATGTGTYSQNMCDPNCAEGTRVDVPVTIKLSKSFQHKGRNVLKTLDIEATNGGDLPTGDASLRWDVTEFAVRMNWDAEEEKK